MLKRMLVAIPVCALAFLAPDAAIAQDRDDAEFEVFGSFSYLIGDVGGSGLGLADLNGVGFQGEFAFFLNDWLGLGAEVGYHTGGLDIPTIAIFPGVDVDFSQWTLLFGPRFRLGGNDRFRVGAQALAGVANGGVEVDFDLEPLALAGPPGGPPGFPFGVFDFDFDFDQTVFAAAFGVNFDLFLTDRLTWRIVEPGVLLTNYGDDGQGHFRIATGIGYEF